MLSEGASSRTPPRRFGGTVLGASRSIFAILSGPWLSANVRAADLRRGFRTQRAFELSFGIIIV